MTASAGVNGRIWIVALSERIAFNSYSHRPRESVACCFQGSGARNHPSHQSRPRSSNSRVEGPSSVMSMVSSGF